MNVRYKQLAKRLTRFTRTMSTRRVVVGVAGFPGAGKTTLCRTICALANEMLEEEMVAVVGMDGFHYTKHHLSQMENPEEAFDRRGSHWTFDAAGFISAVHDLKAKDDQLIKLPTFDHVEGDPVPDSLSIFPSHRVVLVEGNYLFASHLDPWKDLLEHRMFHECWFINCDVEVAVSRVLKRHLGTGDSLERATWKSEKNDRVNTADIYAPGSRGISQGWDGEPGSGGDGGTCGSNGIVLIVIESVDDDLSP